MDSDTKRTLISLGRRIIFSGLIFLGAWAFLIGLRAPAEVALTSEGGLDPAILEQISNIERDWTTSWTSGQSTLEVIAPRVWITVKHVLFGGLLSLGLAAFLLFLGSMIARLTNGNSFLCRFTQILRMILVSSGVALPTFFVALLYIFVALHWGDWDIGETTGKLTWISVLLVALLPTWLLVQVGHGELQNRQEKSSRSDRLVLGIFVKMITTLLKLVGALFITTMLIEVVLAIPGLGRLIISSLYSRDFPILFGAIWVFVPFVILTKLVADLVSITYQHFAKKWNSTFSTNDEKPADNRVPKAWMIICLVLVAISLIVAIFASVLAPFDSNQMSLGDRLAAPGNGYIMGTDQLGRDVFSRLLYGIRIDIFAGFMIAGVLIIISWGWGVAGAALKRLDNWVGDTLEDLIMLPVDIVCAFPWLFLLLLLMGIAWSGLTSVIIMSGLVVLLPRIILMVREAYSSPPPQYSWIISLLWTIPVVLLMAVAGGILYTSTLGFLGAGVAPPTPELGTEITNGFQYLLAAPWLVWPGIALWILLTFWIMAGESLLERLGFRSKSHWMKVYE